MNEEKKTRINCPGHYSTDEAVDDQTLWPLSLRKISGELGQVTVTSRRTPTI